MSKLLSIKDFGKQSAGVSYKPAGCKLCPMAALGKGFCADYSPSEPLIAFIFDMVGSDDVLERVPLAGAQGYYWQKILIEEQGLRRDEVLLSNAIRCKQPNDVNGRPKYPTGFVQKPAELNCRQYDNSLIDFDPNVFVITLHPRTIRTVGAHQIQIIRDVAKAVSFSRRGYRPAVLFGEGVAELYFPWMKNNGGPKNWRGHWWQGEYPWKDSERLKKELTQKKFPTL